MQTNEIRKILSLIMTPKMFGEILTDMVVDITRGKNQMKRIEYLTEMRNSYIASVSELKIRHFENCKKESCMNAIDLLFFKDLKKASDHSIETITGKKAEKSINEKLVEEMLGEGGEG